ncbi:hypothetical protein [Streptomyces graminilatus]|uniref:hypothetical protein n=1 Tax=Streptomyces graminilatus TaxID=1464070 RepID=UPI0006E311DC|nr:hypothetical protein [Streptomyces graminilatus]
MTGHDETPLPRLVVTPVEPPRLDVRWIGAMAERAAAAALELNKAMLTEAARTAGRLARGAVRS